VAPHDGHGAVAEIKAPHAEHELLSTPVHVGLRATDRPRRSCCRASAVHGLGLEAGADDIQSSEEVFEVYTSQHDYEAVLAAIKKAGIEPDALKPADLDETPHRGEIPRAYATRLAHAKATTALANVNLDDELRGAFILAADTVVAVGRRILPKAEDEKTAIKCLNLLSGRRHRSLRCRIEPVTFTPLAAATDARQMLERT
jgi:hypothetical protein